MRKPGHEGSVVVHLTAEDVRTLVNALINVDEFIPDPDFETVMGATRGEVLRMADRLIDEQRRQA